MMTNNNENENPGSLVGHLTELRSRLLKSFIFLILIFLICYFFSEQIYRFLVHPYANAVLSNELGVCRPPSMTDKLPLTYPVLMA